MAPVAIIVCTLDRPKALRVVLESIEQSSIAAARVIVSDDGADPCTEFVCRDARLPVVYVSGPRRGLGPNRNHALRHVDEDTVLFLDDDCQLGPDFLAKALACMHNGEARYGPGCVIVTGVERNRGAIVEAAAQTFLGFQSRPYKVTESITSIVINACLFPRSLFDRYLFDERIRYGYEEVDLASRAARAGYTIVSCPEAVNDHSPSPISRAGRETVTTASRLFVTFKRYAFTDRRYTLAAVYLLIGPAHAIGAATRRRGIAGLGSGVCAVTKAAGYLWSYARDRDTGERAAARSPNG